MERLTKRENGHAHYPRCFEEPCGGMGCRTEDCEFKVEICERLPPTWPRWCMGGGTRTKLAQYAGRSQRKDWMQ